MCTTLSERTAEFIDDFNVMHHVEFSHNKVRHSNCLCGAIWHLHGGKKTAREE